MPRKRALEQGFTDPYISLTNVASLPPSQSRRREILSGPPADDGLLHRTAVVVTSFNSRSCAFDASCVWSTHDAPYANDVKTVILCKGCRVLHGQGDLPIKNLASIFPVPVKD